MNNILVKRQYSSESIKYFCLHVIANEPTEGRRSAGEAAENSAVRRMAYAKKFSIGIEKWLGLGVRCKMCKV